MIPTTCCPVRIRECRHYSEPPKIFQPMKPIVRKKSNMPHNSTYRIPLTFVIEYKWNSRTIKIKILKNTNFLSYNTDENYINNENK